MEYGYLVSSVTDTSWVDIVQQTEMVIIADTCS